ATTGEITSNIQQISDVVQQTARGAEEVSAAAAQLAQQAHQLQNVVGNFRIA
ncbi:MAG TPA: methyl-accepting chemotaxis protein, partial [Geobacter sulfurreducens]|nr:methyl-accepting chemotaxis protein [Geobacter sulfurreducens]